MGFEVNDLCYMDYDTYYQIYQKDFSEYLSWIYRISPKVLEDFSRSNQQEKSSETVSEEDSTMSKQEDFCLHILIFVLEFLSGHYGVWSPSKQYKTLPLTEKFQELISFYGSIGITREEAIGLACRYLCSSKKEYVKRI